MFTLYMYLLGFVLVIIAFVFLLKGVYTSPNNAAASNLNPMKTKNTPERNYLIRFDSIKEQYYITNAKQKGDEDITNAFGFRKYYKEKYKAEYVLEKLNE